MHKVKQGRRKRNKPPEFRPEWIEAFMIMMLHRIGGPDPKARKLTLSVAQLEAFSGASEGKKTQFDYDSESKSITISAPEYEVAGDIILVPGLVLRN